MRVQKTIQRWGNGLAIRISGLMRDIPQFEEGMFIEVDITEDGLLIKKKPAVKKSFTELDLLQGLTPYTAHAEALIGLSKKEMGL